MLDWEPFLSRPFGRAAAVVALSGSLPRLSQVRRFLFPLTGSFDEVRVRLSVSRPVRIVPLLDFKHPLSLEDHEAAADCAREIRECYGPTVLVFGQNRASNELLAWRLRVRGFSAVLDEDLDENWSGLCENKPDFLFVPLGGNLTESVNPPPQSLSAAIVISPGHRPPQLHDRLRAAMQQQGEDVGRTSGVLRDERIAAAVSRVVQAAGRVQRSTQSVQPVFLLNKDFARPDYLTAWPEDWYRNRADEIVCASLSDAIASLDGVHDQK
jgi:Rad3-related DNA helicase